MMYLTQLRPFSAQFHAGATTNDHPAPTGFQPAASFTETPEGFQIQVEIPGIDPTAIELTLDDGQLIIRGEKPQPIANDIETLHLFEPTFGPFERTFSFPTAVRSEAITAESRFGVLSIIIAKAPEAISKKIPITIIN